MTGMANRRPKAIELSLSCLSLVFNSFNLSLGCISIQYGFSIFSSHMVDGIFMEEVSGKLCSICARVLNVHAPGGSSSVVSQEIFTVSF